MRSVVPTPPKKSGLRQERRLDIGHRQVRRQVDTGHRQVRSQVDIGHRKQRAVAIGGEHQRQAVKIGHKISTTNPMPHTGHMMESAIGMRQKV